MEQVLGKIQLTDRDSLVSILQERNWQLVNENRNLRLEVIRLRKSIAAARNNGVEEGLSRAASRPGLGDMGG